MTSVVDMLGLDFTPDLTEGGIVEARRALSRLYVASGHSPYETVRRTIAATAADLAFRRYLAAQRVEYEVDLPVPLSGADFRTVRIGRHACVLKSFFISHPEQLAALETEPDLALKMKAMVPLDRFVNDGLGEQGVYVFSLVLGAVAGPSTTGSKSRSASGEHWLHIMPPKFRRPSAWAPLGPVVIASELSRQIELELGGEDSFGSFIDQRVSLGMEGLLEIKTPFHSLTHVHAQMHPAGNLVLKCSARRLTHAIGERDWEDVWIEGRKVLLLGWLPRHTFQARARLIPSGSHIFQLDRTRTKNLAVDAAELRPMNRLLEPSL